MTCRHEPGDPACRSGNSPKALYAQGLELVRKWGPKARRSKVTPDDREYEVLAAEPVGKHLVLKVRYPACPRCTYEGIKVLVVLNTTLTDALRWRHVDPHFRDEAPQGPEHAPSPAARFPASEEGWNDALAYASSKSKVPEIWPVSSLTHTEQKGLEAQATELMGQRIIDIGELMFTWTTAVTYTGAEGADVVEVKDVDDGGILGYVAFRAGKFILYFSPPEG